MLGVLRDGHRGGRPGHRPRAAPRRPGPDRGRHQRNGRHRPRLAARRRRQSRRTGPRPLPGQPGRRPPAAGPRVPAGPRLRGRPATDPAGRSRRRARGTSLPVRLSLLSVSREPARPAATLTLLAFSLGAMVFAAGWSASLRQGIDDAAAYRSGLDLRVAELGTALSISGSVVPVDRYDALGDDVRLVPVVRDSAANHPGGRVEIVGLAPESLPTLPGWRADFSDTPITELATALTLPTPDGGWTLVGHRLDPADEVLDLRFTYRGHILRLDAVVRLDNGDSVVVRMGDVEDSMQSAVAPLPPDARGGLLTALVFRNPGLLAGSGHQDILRRATVAFQGLDGLVDEEPRQLEIYQTATEIIRPPQVTDGLAIPAIVSPDLAATADASGRIELGVANEAVVPLQVVGVADHMPTVVSRDAPLHRRPERPVPRRPGRGRPGCRAPDRDVDRPAGRRSGGIGPGGPRRRAVPLRRRDRAIRPHRRAGPGSDQPGDRLDPGHRRGRRPGPVDRRPHPRCADGPPRRARRAGRPGSPGREPRPAPVDDRGQDRVAGDRRMRGRPCRRARADVRRDQRPGPHRGGHGTRSRPSSS